MYAQPGAPRRRIPVLFLIVLFGIVEFWLIVRVAAYIGAGTVILMILCTTAFGFWLLRTQWQDIGVRMQAQLAKGALPQDILGDGLGFLASAVLLILPGFLTDLLGLLLFIPQLRRLIAVWLLNRLNSSRKMQSPGFMFGSQFTMHTWTSGGSTTTTGTTDSHGTQTINVTVHEPDGSIEELEVIDAGPVDGEVIDLSPGDGCNGNGPDGKPQR